MPRRRGAARPAGDVLMVGEGIETCLAAMQATGHPAWAALSTSGLRALDLPARRARRDRARRWRRTRRSGGAGLRPALEARGAPRSHRPSAAGHGFQRSAAGSRASHRGGHGMTTDNPRSGSPPPSTTPKKSTIQPHPKSWVKSLGCWLRTATPIGRSRRFETCLLTPVGFMTEACPSASPSTRSSGARSRR